MKVTDWEIKLGIALLAASSVIYAVKFVILGDPQNTFFYIFNALGFLPINVLLVTLILNQLLSIRARRERLEKLNMVIGTFFSEIGTHLLASLSDHDTHLGEIQSHLLVSGNWEKKDYDRVQKYLFQYSYEVDAAGVNLEELHRFLVERRTFLLRLLENPVLLEHERFTELLRAAFHLAEELDAREDLQSLPDADLRHLAGDMTRVYRLLAIQWLAYMRYLQKAYPFLFSLALRTNPFDENASPVVR